MTGPFDDLRTLDRMAWRAAWSAFSSWLDPHERHDVALGSIAEGVAKAAAEGRSADPLELHQSAVAAIGAETSASRRDHGLTAPHGFARYWLDDRRPIGDPDEVPPRVALAQCFDALPGRHRESLLLLALHGDPQSAAAAADCTYPAMQKRIRAARVAFYALWFDGEAPPSPPFDRRTPAVLADRCGAGHEYTPENTRWRKATSRRGKKRACRACDAAAEMRRKDRAS